MRKDDFITARTNILSKMLDNPNEYGIYPTTVCFAELDDLYDQMNIHGYGKSGAQKLRDEMQVLTPKGPAALDSGNPTQEAEANS